MHVLVAARHWGLSLEEETNVKFYFQCDCHHEQAKPFTLTLDTDPILIRCSVSGEKAQVPQEVLTKLEGVSAGNAMISSFDVTLGKRILRNIWPEMPPSFPFTLVAE